MSDGRAPSIRNYREGEVVQRMLDEPPHWNPFLQIHGVSSGARCLAELPLRPLLPAQGDVDVLAVDPNRPEDACAYQVKKIKVGDATFTTQAPNGLADLAKLHRQSQLLLELGFGCVYSAVLILVDSRSRASEQNQYATLTGELRQVIDAALAQTKVEAGLGLVRIDYTQSFEGPLLHSGMSGISLLRSAVRRQQSAQVTTWVREMVQTRVRTAEAAQ